MLVFIEVNLIGFKFVVCFPFAAGITFQSIEIFAQSYLHFWERPPLADLTAIGGAIFPFRMENAPILPFWGSARQKESRYSFAYTLAFS